MRKIFTFVAALFVAMTMNAEAITVAQAIEIGTALEDNKTTEDEYTVEGYVLNPTYFSLFYKNQTWDMADDATNSAGQVFKGYISCLVKDGDTVRVLAGDKVQLTGKLKKYVDKNKNVTIEVEKGVATPIELAEGDRSLDYSVTKVTLAEAVAIGQALNTGDVTPKQYEIEGYATAMINDKNNTYSDGGWAKYGNQSFWIAAEAGGENAFEVYQGVASQEVKVGDQVRLVCQIKNYNGTIENADTKIPVELPGVTPVEEADVTFLPADFKGMGTSTTGSEVVKAKDGITITASKAYGHDLALRVYKGSSLSIVSATEQIAKIVFSVATVSGTTYDGGLDKEIIVNAKEWKVDSLKAQLRAEKIQIYFGTAEVPQLDTITATEAKARAEALAENTTSDKVAILCYVASVKTAYDATYGNITVWLNDDPTSTYGNIQAYRALVSAEYGPNVKAGDKVLVVGKLSHSTYTPDGTDEERHSYQIAQGAEMTLIEEAAEGIENVVLTEKAQKVMVDGVMYIIRDNKMYNLQGTQVR